jgi:hypothetical protein
MQKRVGPIRLLKKTSPDLQAPTSFHRKSIAMSKPEEHPAPRSSTRATSLHKKGKTALFKEMPRSISLTYTNSRHESRPSKRTKQRTSQIQPMESGFLLQNAKKDKITTEKLLVYTTALLHVQLTVPH